MEYRALLVLIAGPLCLLLFVFGLHVQHQQILSGRTEGKALGWLISILCFLGSALFSFLLWTRLEILKSMSGL